MFVCYENVSGRNTIWGMGESRLAAELDAEFSVEGWNSDIDGEDFVRDYCGICPASDELVIKISAEGGDIVWHKDVNGTGQPGNPQ